MQRFLSWLEFLETLGHTDTMKTSIKVVFYVQFKLMVNACICTSLLLKILCLDLACAFPSVHSFPNKTTPESFERNCIAVNLSCCVHFCSSVTALAPCNYIAAE